MSNESYESGMIMGWYRLEPEKYMDENRQKKTCPLKNGGQCDGKKCAVWNYAKGIYDGLKILQSVEYRRNPNYIQKRILAKEQYVIK